MELMPFWMFFMLMIAAQARSFNQRPPGRHREIWRPHDRSRDTWLRCHGFSCSQWERIRKKMFDLQMTIAGPGFSVPHGMRPDQGPDTLDPCLWLTEQQIDLMLFKLNHRGGHGPSNMAASRNTAFNGGLFRMWPTTVHWKFDGMHDANEQNQIRAATHHWEEQTCVRFKELPTEQHFADNHILITKESTGCHSFLGRTNQIPQQLNLQDRCLREFGTMVHEIGHALGLFHEQQRADRDRFIRIVWENLGYYAGQFYKHETDDLVPYDYSSVMHYGPLVGTRSGGQTMIAVDPMYQQTMGQRTGLSFLDSKLINHIYCNGVCTTPLPRPCQHGGYQNPNDCGTCKCPEGLGGTFCEQVAPAHNAKCGGHIHFDVGSPPVHIQSPGYDNPGYYSNDQGCAWWIHGPKDLQINLEFQGQFGLYCGSQRQCMHWVEVRTEVDIGTLGPRFCCEDPPSLTLTSKGNEMLVVFRANISQPFTWKQRGFRAMVWAGSPGVRPVAVPKTTPAPTKPTSTIRATTTSSGPECAPVDLVFVLDADTPKRDPREQIPLVVDIIQRSVKAPVSGRIGVITFSKQASSQFSLGTHPSIQDAVEAIDKLPLSSSTTGTDVYAGLHEMRGQFLENVRPGVRRVAVLVTDGGDVDSWRSILEAQAANADGVELFVIGVDSRFIAADARWMVVDGQHIDHLQSYSESVDESLLKLIRGPDCLDQKSWSCSFENADDPLCGMEQSTADNIDWTRRSGATPSSLTGPAAAQHGSFYMYIEATNRRPDDRAIMYFPPLETSGALCVSFHYNMYGFHIRKLELTKVSPNGSSEVLWQRAGEAGRQWNLARMEVNVTSEQRLALVGTRGDEYSGDIAVDNIIVEFGECTMSYRTF